MIPRDMPVAWTSKNDVGRAVAELARLSLDPATRSSVSQDVRIAGCHATAAEVAALTGKIIRANTHEVDVASIKQHLKQLQDAGKEDLGDEYICRFIRCV